MATRQIMFSDWLEFKTSQIPCVVKLLHGRNLPYDPLDSFWWIENPRWPTPLTQLIKNETLRQKRWFQFPHCDFSINCSIIPEAHAYCTCIYIFHLIRYSRDCGYYHEFLYTWLLLPRKLLNLSEPSSKLLNWSHHF